MIASKGEFSELTLNICIFYRVNVINNYQYNIVFILNLIPDNYNYSWEGDIIKDVENIKIKLKVELLESAWDDLQDVFNNTSLI